MSDYNISDNVQDTFNFESHGLKYVMRYPMTSEIEEMQEMSRQIVEADKDEREDDVKSLSKKMEDYTYSFIEPDGHETPIREALKKENVRVMRNFSRMLKAELSIQ